MVKLKGQLMSLEASGTLDKTVIYSSWKGRPYAKHFKVPTDPKTVAQLGIRAMMNYLSKQWAGLTTNQQESWETTAHLHRMTPMNVFLSRNLSRFAAHEGPTKQFPATEQSFLRSIQFDSTTAYDRYIELEIHGAGFGDVWGFIVYRNQSSMFATAPNNAIAVYDFPPASPTTTLQDTPLCRGTWYYRFQPFNSTGKMNIASGQMTVVF